MRPLYHEMNSQLEIFVKTTSALPPHLHKYLECIYVLEGSFCLGIKAEQFEMHPRDLAVIFPETIHHFSVEKHGPSQAICFMGDSSLAGPFEELLQKYDPRTPFIPKELVHPDIPYTLNRMLNSREDPYGSQLMQAYFQILLARILPVCGLLEKKEPETPDLALQAVSYISKNFKEDISLAAMSHDLCVSPYVLSRVFSGILCTNFNRYLNEIRLDHASYLLRTTSESITDIFINSGFRSQTTFNRAFKEKYRTSPRDYRIQNQQISSRLTLPFLSDGSVKDTADLPSESCPWALMTGRFL